MKITIRLAAVIMSMVLLLTSCGKNSLRPHDPLEPINIVFMHVGWWGSTSTEYSRFTDSDLKKLADIGVDEVCISFGAPIMTYIPQGETEPVEIVSQEDVLSITKDLVDTYDELGVLSLHTAFSEKLKERDQGLVMNQFAEYALELAERLVEVNPDIELWYFFPEVLISTLAEKYIDPLLEYYDIMKNGTAPEVWEKNVQGFYWGTEDIPCAPYSKFDTENEVDFNNAMVKAMKACSDKVHDDGKLTFWCPYYRSTSTIDTATAIGYVANRTDIFDYVILQPNHLFADNLEYNLDLLRNAALQNAVLDHRGKVVGGEKISSTMIGPEMEMEANLFNGKDGEEMVARYKDYVNAYKDLRGEYSMAYYCGERNSMMSYNVFGFLKEFLQDEDPS